MESVTPADIAYSAALCTLALGIVPVFWVYLSLMVVSGVALPLFNTPFVVTLQVQTVFFGRNKLVLEAGEPVLPKKEPAQ